MEKLRNQLKTSDNDTVLGDGVEGTKFLEDQTLPQSLDQFLTKYESEDDASFKEMLVMSKEMNHQKHAWLHAKEQEYAIASEKKLAITGNTSEIQRPAGLDSWTYTAKNSLMYIPDGFESSAMETMDRASKNREIVHSNTRLPPQYVQRFQQSGGNNRPVQDKVGVDGKTLIIEDSPKVNGYGFLATPIIKPGIVSLLGIA